MTSFDDAIAAARRDVESRDRAAHAQAEAQHRHDAELAEQATQILADAARQFATLGDSLHLQLARPRKRFERARVDISDQFGTRYVVAHQYRGWALPPHGRGASGVLLLTEHGGLFHVVRGIPADNQPPALFNLSDPAALPVAELPPAVDIRAEFAPASGPHRDELDPYALPPNAPILRNLRNALAQSFVAYERALHAGEPVADLYRKWPYEWRREPTISDWAAEWATNSASLER